MNQFDFSKWPRSPSGEVWADYLKFRKMIKKPITQTVVNRMGKRVTELVFRSWDVDEILGLCMQEGWRGLEVKWFYRFEEPGSPLSVPTQKTRDRSLQEDLNDRSWAT